MRSPPLALIDAASFCGAAQRSHKRYSREQDKAPEKLPLFIHKQVIHRNPECYNSEPKSCVRGIVYQ